MRDKIERVIELFKAAADAGAVDRNVEAREIRVLFEYINSEFTDPSDATTQLPAGSPLIHSQACRDAVLALTEVVPDELTSSMYENIDPEYLKPALGATVMKCLLRNRRVMVTPSTEWFVKMYVSISGIILSK